MMARGILHPGLSVSIAATPTATGNGDSREGMAGANATVINGASLMTDQVGEYHPGGERIVAASPDAEQNADEAAEYWARL